MVTFTSTVEGEGWQFRQGLQHLPPGSMLPDTVGITSDATVLRAVPWRAAVAQTFPLSPILHGTDGAQGKVPGASGEAFSAYRSGTREAGRTSDEGLAPGVEMLP